MLVLRMRQNNVYIKKLFLEKFQRWMTRASRHACARHLNDSAVIIMYNGNGAFCKYVYKYPTILTEVGKSYTNRILCFFKSCRLKATLRKSQDKPIKRVSLDVQHENKYR